MKSLTFTLILSFLIQFVFAQNQFLPEQNTNHGKFYFYWGWNWDWFTKSNISFSGNEYDFRLDNVVAKDRQSMFKSDIYLNPMNATIPQYNFRMGYFFNDKWNISLGIDHMKYVMQADQVVNIAGYINNSQTEFDGEYSGDEIRLTKDFVQFEHTDGLNYINIEIRRFDHLATLSKMKINFIGGMGLGGLYPRTNVTLLNNERNDEFHFAGYGVDAVAGINFTFFDIVFIQTELKGGYINMPDIRTTSSSTDHASQHFFFSQYNIVFGGIINFRNKNVSN